MLLGTAFFLLGNPLPENFHKLALCVGFNIGAIEINRTQTGDRLQGLDTIPCNFRPGKIQFLQILAEFTVPVDLNLFITQFWSDSQFFARFLEHRLEDLIVPRFF